MEEKLIQKCSPSIGGGVQEGDRQRNVREIGRRGMFEKKPSAAGFSASGDYENGGSLRKMEISDGRKDQSTGRGESNRLAGLGRGNLGNATCVLRIHEKEESAKKT